MKLQEILNSYIKKVSEKPIHGGAETGTSTVNDDILVDRLAKNSLFNNRLIIVYVTTLLLSFLLVCVLIWYFIPDKTAVLGLLGGEGLSIVFIIKSIHRLYRDKVFTDQLRYLMPKLSTEAEKIKYIEALSDFLK